MPVIFANPSEIYQLIANSINDVVSLHAFNGTFLFVNPAAQKVLGYSPSELINCSVFELCYPEDVHKFQVMNLMQRTRHQSKTILWRCRTKEGKYIYLETKATQVFNEEGYPHALLFSSRDVTERENLLAKLSASSKELKRQKRALERANLMLTALASVDGLTGLKNHRIFQEQLEMEFRRAQRYQLPLSLLMIDVDHFKLFNDTYGHLAGDEVLQHVARLLTLTARQTDLVSRYGGEEFAVILPNTPAEGATVLAERYRNIVSSENWPLRQITISVGVATLTPAIQTRTELIEQADRALYHAKLQGRNCVVHIYDIQQP